MVSGKSTRYWCYVYRTESYSNLHHPPLRRGSAEADLGGHCTKESAHEIGNTQAHEPGGIMEI